MAYGIEVLNDNGTVQFSSEAQESLTVINYGTCGPSNSVTYDGNNEILCFNRSTTGWINGNTNSFATSWTNASGVTVNWIKLKRASTDTADDTADYGIEVYKSDGTSINFSSNFSKAQNITDIIAPRSVFSLNNTIAGSPEIHTGDPTGLYVGVGRMTYFESTNNDDLYDNIYFDYIGNKIRMREIFSFRLYFSKSWVGRFNLSTLLVFNTLG
jgi:hypothetical protein